MHDELHLGAEPRRHRRRPTRRHLVVAAVLAVVVAGVGTLLAARPWRDDPTARLVATGRSCTAGYGASLLVAAVELANPTTVPTTLTGVDLGPAAVATDRFGGPIDIVTADGCDHVLANRGHVVPPGDVVWVGLSVRVTTCAAVAVPVATSYDAGGLTVDVAVGSAATPACRDGGPPVGP